MASFTWEESALTADCHTLSDMANRFEETAALMRRLEKNGFEVQYEHGLRKIIHRNPRIFSRFGFIIDKVLSDIEQSSIDINNDRL